MEKISSSIVNVCIFYDRLCWHNLISGFIKPFIQKEREAGRLKSYNLSLSTERGDHFKLGVSCVEDSAVVEGKVVEVLQAFLTNHPSQRITKAAHQGKGFFMDHYNNSFWFDKYAAGFITLPGLTAIKEQISAAIIAALGNEEIGQEIIYSFIIYMQLGCIKAAYPDLQDACTHIQEVINHLENQELGELEGAIKEDSLERHSDSSEHGQELLNLFEDNKEVLVEILEDIWNENGYTDELKWMEAWVSSCRSFLGDSDFKQSYILLNHHIYQHLGIMMDKEILSISSVLLLNAFDQSVEKQVK